MSKGAKERLASSTSSLSCDTNSQEAVRQIESVFHTIPMVCTSEDHVQALINARRARDILFGKHLFSDPAWDIILELYRADLAAERVRQSELALVLSAPRSVTARWTAALMKAGIVYIAANPPGEDRLVRLTAESTKKMRRLLECFLATS